MPQKVRYYLGHFLWKEKKSLSGRIQFQLENKKVRTADLNPFFKKYFLKNSQY